ncbi:hypothetical protein [Chitinophaga pinensis]|uniref:Uncharacterized protein n=1 Tax=Chitinophaga pinensis TaxID=79329 RepID=A0A5C6LIR1_9BACT|nr:hypothetical protein [Chitinophaga pinensis]TWV92997.1 hypothetical protein FEF09_27850 [Chitinophaga pinensis]
MSKYAIALLSLLSIAGIIKGCIGSDEEGNKRTKAEPPAAAKKIDKINFFMETSAVWPVIYRVQLIQKENP